MPEADDFDLLEEKWIPCIAVPSYSGVQAVDKNHQVPLFSIREVLTEAKRFEEIIGDNPLVTISIYRLLIAILHDALKGPVDDKQWAEWWEAKAFPSESLNRYFEQNHSSFDLFSESRPFYQTAEFRQIGVVPLPKLGDKLVKPVWKFFLEGEDFTTTFEHTNDTVPADLTPAEAARHLLAFQNFDVGSLQSRVTKGISKEEAKLLVSADAGLLNRCAVALIRGKNLFETLLLNLVRYDPPNEIPFRMRNNLPAWGQSEVIDPTSDTEINGYLNLLTWQSRQVRLYPNRGSNGDFVVNHVVVMKGNNLNGDLFGREQMVAFEKNSNAEWQPVMFRSERVIWRDSLALFQKLETGGKSSRPRTFDWLNDLAANKKLSSDEFAVDLFGIGGSKAKPLFWRHERLPMPLAYLENQRLCDELREALKLVEIVATLLWKGTDRMSVLHFLPDLRFDFPDWFDATVERLEKRATEERVKKYRKSKQHKQDFTEPDALTKSLAPELHYWNRLETPFRRILLNLAEDDKKWKQQRQEWARVVSEITLLAFSEVAFALGDSPRVLRAVSIARTWLEIELNMRKKAYLCFAKLEDDDTGSEPEEENVEE